MVDNKSGRDKQADDERKRQLERDMLEQRERGDETKPPVDPETLDEFERELATIEFPATAETVVAELGDWEIEAADSTYTVEELLPASDAEVLPDPETVRLQVQRPTVARAMKQILEAARELSAGAVQESQRDAYEKTF
jgi:predicted RNA-binding Zn ribbon-like protein